MRRDRKGCAHARQPPDSPDRDGTRIRRGGSRLPTPWRRRSGHGWRARAPYAGLPLQDPPGRLNPVDSGRWMSIRTRSGEVHPRHPGMPPRWPRSDHLKPVGRSTTAAAANRNGSWSSTTSPARSLSPPVAMVVRGCLRRKGASTPSGRGCRTKTGRSSIPEKGCLPDPAGRVRSLTSDIRAHRRSDRHGHPVAERQEPDSGRELRAIRLPPSSSGSWLGVPAVGTSHPDAVRRHPGSFPAQLGLDMERAFLWC